MNEFVQKNPFKKLGVSKQRIAAEQNSRLGFSGDELLDLFDSPLYVHHDQANHTFLTQNPISRNKNFDWQYWCLLLLLTGARLAEVTGLRRCDVIMMGEYDEARLVLDINGGGKRRLKNESAKRLIPVNKELIDLGFKKFVDACQAEYLFSELPWTASQGKAENFRRVSEWFNGTKDRRRGDKPGYKHRCGVVIEEGAKKDLHSLRHNVGTLYKNQPLSIPTHMHQHLIGHHQGGANFTHKTYGDTYDISVLCDIVDQIDLSEILGNVRPWEPADALGQVKESVVRPEIDKLIKLFQSR